MKTHNKSFVFTKLLRDLANHRPFSFSQVNSTDTDHGFFDEEGESHGMEGIENWVGCV